MSLTSIGGNSAVRVLDSTGCSINPSSSLSSDIRLEFDRYLEAVWLSARLRASAWDALLVLFRLDALARLVLEQVRP